ncbi:hypothetical protein BJV78DRAFT_1101525, partial [Lactifluus subvellereus]
HSSAHNAIEQIFGILKRRFMILTHPPEYSMAVQAHIPPGLAAIHNFICIYDPEEILDFDYISEDPGPSFGSVALGPANLAEREEATAERDRIAQAMWTGYQEEL